MEEEEYMGKISKAKRKRILERDNYTCQVCGQKVNDKGSYHENENYYNIDHIVPLSKCGTNKDSNLRVTCKRCNCSKQNKQINDFISLYKSMIIDFEKRRQVIDDALSIEGSNEYINGLEEIKDIFISRIDKEMQRVVK